MPGRRCPAYSSLSGLRLRNDVVESSKELFINMKPEDIPWWDPALPYGEQEPPVREFWQGEAEKLTSGIRIGGVYIHPWLYWHLNFWHMMVDEGVRRVPRLSMLRDNEWFFAEVLKQAEEENKGIFMFGTRRFGKALLDSELVYMEGGEKEIGKLPVGARIFCADGKLHEVTGVYPQGKVMTYRVVFADGRTVVCSADHLWRVWHGGRWEVRRLGEILKRGGTWEVPLPGAVSYPDARLPLDASAYGMVMASCLSGTGGDPLPGVASKRAYLRSSPRQKGMFIEAFIKGMKGIVTGEETLKVAEAPLGSVRFVLRMFWASGWYASFDEGSGELFVSNLRDRVAMSSVEPYGKRGATCITVDSPGNVFLTTNYIVTHNSSIMSSYLAYNATMTYNLSHNVVCGSREDLLALATYLEYGLDNMHPFLKINRTGNNWEKEVVMGTRNLQGERDIHARIQIVNANNSAAGGALRTAGSTPYTSIYDEVGKYPFLAPYLAGRPAHMAQGRMRGMIIASGCVCAGTMVRRGDRREVPVEDLDAGDGIYGINVRRRGGWVKEEITWMQPPTEKDCCRLEVSYKGVRTYLECSWDHPVYCFNPGGRDRVHSGYVMALFLEPGEFVGVVGKDGVLHRGLLESVVGIGVKPVYNFTAGGWHNYVANGILTHNTGGNVEKSQDAQKVMNDPARYHFLVMDYGLLDKHAPNPTWRRCKSGIFVPGQMSHAFAKKPTTLGDYLGLPRSRYLGKIRMEVTDFDATTADIRGRLNSLADGDKEVYVQEKMAYPLTIDDCFLNTRVNRFPVEDAVKHKNELLEEGGRGKRVDVVKLVGNRMEQHPSEKPMAQYPFKGGNIDAPVLIFEDPPESGGVLDYTYVSGLDNYKQEKADTDSVGTFYVFKRAVGINDPYANRIVASYASRPASSEDFCRTVETLIEAYGARCLMENADRIFELYLARQGKDRVLLEDGEALANRIIKPGARQNNRLGLTATPVNQRMLFSAVLQYCWEEVVLDYDETGEEIKTLGIYRIDDIGLLDEIISYSKGVNVDRIIAFGHALLLARYADDMNYFPESSTEKENARKRREHERKQLSMGGFVINKRSSGFVSRSGGGW